MSNVRFTLLIALSCLAAVGLSPSAHAVVLDWDSVTWTPGDLSHSYDVTGDGQTDVTVLMTAQQNNIWTNDPTTGTQTPAILQSLNGGLPQNALMIAANLKTHSDATIQLNFTAGQWGATNVSFTIFDIDITTNSDIISNIYGVALDGSHVAATLSNVGSTVTVTGSGLTLNLEGNAPNANNSSNGNVTLSFGSTIITDVFFTFSNTAGAPRYQDIALGDISFTPVPEMNPSVISAASCVVAAGLTVFMRRRAKRRLSAR